MYFVFTVQVNNQNSLSILTIPLIKSGVLLLKQKTIHFTSERQQFLVYINLLFAGKLQMGMIHMAEKQKG